MQLQRKVFCDDLDLVAIGAHSRFCTTSSFKGGIQVNLSVMHVFYLVLFTHRLYDADFLFNVEGST